MAAFYGLRRSEVLGLKWDSVDFQNSRVLIRHTVVKVTETIEKDKTKNQSSRRSFPMTDEIRSIFLALKAEQEENRRLFGKEYQESAAACRTFVFTSCAIVARAFFSTTAARSRMCRSGWDTRTSR